jgi:tetratricopeptide (TPR) repeat protein
MEIFQTAASPDRFEVSAWRKKVMSVARAALSQVTRASRVGMRRRTWKWLALMTKGIRVLVVDLGAIIGIAVIATAVVYEIRKDTVEIEPIDVPKDLTDAGFNSKVIAQRLMDHVRIIEQSAKTRMTTRSLSMAGQRLDFVVPGAGISVATVASYFKDAFGWRTVRIGGELTDSDGKISLRLRVNGKGSIATPPGVNVTDLDIAFKAAAEQIIRETEPYVLASAFYGEKDTEKALGEIRRIINALPHSDENVVRAFCLWGLILYDQKKYGEARKQYEHAIDLALQVDIAASNLGNGYYNLGNLLLDIGDTEGAKLSYRKAIEADPEFAFPYASLGNLLVDDDDQLAAAVANLERSVDLDPKYSFAYAGLGNALQRSDDVEGAIVNFRQAILLDPGDGYAHRSLGRVLWTKGEFEDAIASYRLAIDIDGNDAIAYNWLGIAQNDNGDLDDAEASYRKAIELYSEYADPHYRLGFLMEAKGDYDDAIVSYQKAIGIDPTYAYAFYNLAVEIYNLEAQSEARKSNLTDACGHLKIGHTATPEDEDFVELALDIDSELKDFGSGCALN